VALRVTRAVLDEIALHARASAPHECCGVLLGAPGDPTTVTGLLRARNAEKRSPTERYAVDHGTQLAALELEIAGESETAGYYHSHPRGGSEPSPTDEQEAVEDTVYVICGLAQAEPTFAAWRSGRNGLTPEPMEIVE